MLSEQMWEVEEPRFCAVASHCGNLVERRGWGTCLKLCLQFVRDKQAIFILTVCVFRIT